MIELLICIAIIAAISGVTLARYKSFNSTILLRNLAYEIALSIREAQVLGISVQGVPGVTNPFGYAYGMHFMPGKTTYTLFRDLDGDLQYDDDEAVTVYTIGQKNAVTDVCDSTACGLASLDVLFKRPDPDARFYPNPAASAVWMVVGAPDGNTRTIKVWPTGQIAVQ